jgi:hypothetical protein
VEKADPNLDNCKEAVPQFDPDAERRLSHRAYGRAAPLIRENIAYLTKPRRRDA